MAKKIKIDLNYSGETLWWSTDDGVNWGIVGPKSPVSVLDPGAEVQWKADRTISSVEIEPENDKVLEPITGSPDEKSSRVKSSCKTGDRCKYNIVVTIAGTGKKLVIDPDLKICVPPCYPGG